MTTNMTRAHFEVLKCESSTKFPAVVQTHVESKLQIDVVNPKLSNFNPAIK